jgi:hypothetical protein
VYGIASHLPSYLLDALINIPQFLISIRNSLLPVPPAIPQSQPPASEPPAAPTTAADVDTKADDQESGNDLSEPGSEADVESNAGDGSSVDNSWVSLKKKSLE